MKENIEQYSRITSDVPGPRVLLSAGVHGDEYEPIVAAAELLKSMPRLLKGCVTIAAVVSGSAFRTSSRFGTDGLDLARTCPGNANGSVTERAAAEISALIREADYYVDMHTGGLTYDLYPLAGYMLHPDEKLLETQRKMALAFDLPVIWGTDFRPDGRTISVARDAGVPAIYLEYGGGSGFREDVVKSYKNGFLNFLKQLEMIEYETGENSSDARFWVEDHRSQSGYLQGKMPAPAEGIFRSRVKLGEMVKKGQSWGEILNPLKDENTPVFADMSGLVFMLRALVNVKKGDALGGILPITGPGKIDIYA